MYQKVGMFGMAGDRRSSTPERRLQPQGDQIRGFGFLHDGSVDTVFRFMSTVGFAASPANPGGFPMTAAGNILRRNVEAFVLAYDSNLQPVVGQQTTLTGANAPVVGPRIDLLRARASLGDCDLVAKSRLGEHELGFTSVGGQSFQSNRQAWPALSDVALRALASVLGLEVTYTCTPPGSGVRLGIDRDGDGALDGDEEDAGSNPADPASTP